MPDWDKSVGVTTPRVDTPTEYVVKGWPTWEYTSPAHVAEREDRAQRTESGDEKIWRAYEEGY